MLLSEVSILWLREAWAGGACAARRCRGLGRRRADLADKQSDTSPSPATRASSIAAALVRWSDIAATLSSLRGRVARVGSSNAWRPRGRVRWGRALRAGARPAGVFKFSPSGAPLSGPGLLPLCACHGGCCENARSRRGWGQRREAWPVMGRASRGDPASAGCARPRGRWDPGPRSCPLQGQVPPRRGWGGVSGKPDSVEAVGRSSFSPVFCGRRHVIWGSALPAGSLCGEVFAFPGRADRDYCHCTDMISAARVALFMAVLPGVRSRRGGVGVGTRGLSRVVPRVATPLLLGARVSGIL